jgi:spore germination cell wall hydrolase CwlJ-like protein
MWKLLFVTAQVAAIMAVVMSAEAEPMRIDIPLPEPVDLDPQELRCLAKNIYFEARNQDAMAMSAVANVTLNRVASPDFPDSVCEVVKQGPLDGSEIEKHRCQFSWYCDGKPDIVPISDDWPEVVAWEWSQLIAEMVLAGEAPDITEGSTYYHADYVEPHWAEEYTQITTVGRHAFYKHN